jgi:hypothetical protein
MSMQQSHSIAQIFRAILRAAEQPVIQSLAYKAHREAG